MTSCLDYPSIRYHNGLLPNTTSFDVDKHSETTPLWLLLQLRGQQNNKEVCLLLLQCKYQLFGHFKMFPISNVHILLIIWPVIKIKQKKNQKQNCVSASGHIQFQAEACREGVSYLTTDFCQVLSD